MNSAVSCTIIKQAGALGVTLPSWYLAWHVVQGSTGVGELGTAGHLLADESQWLASVVLCGYSSSSVELGLCCGLVSGRLGPGCGGAAMNKLRHRECT